MMSSFLKADAVRIWKDGNEVEWTCPLSFLWEDIVGMESEHGSGIKWEDRQPKTVIHTLSGDVYYVIGPFKRWNDKWDRYLTRSENRLLLHAN